MTEMMVQSRSMYRLTSRIAALLFATVAAAVTVRFAFVLLTSLSDSGGPLFTSEGAALLRRVGMVLLGALTAAGVLASLTLAGLLVRRRADRAYVDDLILFLTTSAVFAAAWLMPRTELALGARGLPTAWWWNVPGNEEIGAMATYVSALALLRFSVRFPVPLSRRTDGGVISRVTCRLGLTHWPWLLVPAVALVPLDESAAYSMGMFSQSWSLVGLIVVVVLMFSASVHNLARSGRVADEAERARARFALASLIVFALAVAFALATALYIAWMVDFMWTLVDLVFGLGYLLHVVLLMWAVLHDGALDASLVIKKTTLAAGAGLCLVFLFAGLEEVLTGWALDRVGLPAGIGSFVAAGIVAVIAVLWRSRRDAAP